MADIQKGTKYTLFLLWSTVGEIYHLHHLLQSKYSLSFEHSTEKVLGAFMAHGIFLKNKANNEVSMVGTSSIWMYARYQLEECNISVI